jgi:hypothetical protein
VAVQFINTANSTSTGGAALTINKPTDTVEDDWMIAIVSAWKASGEFSIAHPAGWTELWEDTYELAGERQRIWMGWLKAGAAEGASYTWTGTTWAESCGAISTYRGADLTTQIDASGRNANTSGAPTAPTISPATANTMLLYLVGNAAAAPNTPPADMIERVDVANAGNDAIYMAEQRLYSSGATGTREGTLGGNGANTAALIALKEFVWTPEVDSASKTRIVASPMAWR